MASVLHTGTFWPLMTRTDRKIGRAVMAHCALPGRKSSCVGGMTAIEQSVSDDLRKWVYEDLSEILDARLTELSVVDRSALFLRRFDHEIIVDDQVRANLLLVCVLHHVESRFSLCPCMTLIIIIVFVR